jgi:type IV secretion system protein VirD4
MDADEGGPRLQPELTEIATHSLALDALTNDLALLDDDDAPLPLPRQIDPAMQRTARLAALDPDDGITL